MIYKIAWKISKEPQINFLNSLTFQKNKTSKELISNTPNKDMCIVMQDNIRIGPARNSIASAYCVGAHGCASEPAGRTALVFHDPVYGPSIFVVTVSFARSGLH